MHEHDNSGHHDTLKAMRMSQPTMTVTADGTATSARCFSTAKTMFRIKPAPTVIPKTLKAELDQYGAERH